MTPALEQFFDRRQRIIDSLWTSGLAVSEWYQQLKTSEPGLRELARLEGLLAERKDQLERLMKLDDEMLDRLVQVRSQQGTPPE